MVFGAFEGLDDEAGQPSVDVVPEGLDGDVVEGVSSHRFNRSCVALTAHSIPLGQEVRGQRLTARSTTNLGSLAATSQLPKSRRSFAW
jgi:hypothetical protein